MTGADFRALVRLSSKANDTLADVGKTCERVPAESLPWLLATGRIEPVDQAWVDLSQETT